MVIKRWSSQRLSFAQDWKPLHISRRDSGTTVLLVEQNIKAALNIAQRAIVLETGVILLEGLAVDLLDNPKAKEANLGG